MHLPTNGPLILPLQMTHPFESHSPHSKLHLIHYSEKSKYPEGQVQNGGFSLIPEHVTHLSAISTQVVHT